MSGPAHKARLAALLLGVLAGYGAPWVAFWPGPVRAQSIVSTGESFADLGLLAGQAAADGTRMAGVAIDLEPGWKTYWRSPGEAGIPPRFDFSGSGNLAGWEILWPRPVAFESFGLRTLGYDGRVVLPLVLTPEDPARAIDLDMRVEFGVCAEICVFEEAHVVRAIAPDDQEGGIEIAMALAAVPVPGAEAGIEAATCRIEGTGTERRFAATLRLAEAAARSAGDGAPMVIVEGGEAAFFHGAEARVEGGAIAVEAGLTLASETAWIGRGGIRMTVLAKDFAADVQGCTAPGG